MVATTYLNSYEAQAVLGPLARVDNDVARKLKGWLDPMEAYLLDQLQHCRCGC